MRFLSGITLTALLASSLAAQQQAGSPAPMPASLKSFTSKFFVTGALNGAAISLEGSNTSENGQGGSLGLGYGFTPKFAGYIEGSGARMSSDDGNYTLAHFDIGARYHFANMARAWIPFVDAAFSGRTVQQNDYQMCTPGCTTDDLSMTGTGFSLGGGVMWYASRKVAISANLHWTNGEFNEVKYGNVTVTGLNQDATSTRFGLGMVWFPGAK